MIAFVGAGAGAADLITVRGQKYLQEADIIVYAGSLSLIHIYSSDRSCINCNCAPVREERR